MSILYYVPKLQAISKPDLSRFGIDEVFGRQPIAQRSTSPGPDGHGGVVFGLSVNGKDSRIGYFPDRQEWQEFKTGENSVFLGRDENNLPTPDNMARSEEITGHQVELLDGNKWTIPLARSFPEGMVFGMAYSGIGKDGKPIKEILPKYVEICRIAEKAWNGVQFDLGWVEDGDLADFPDDQILTMACQFLTLNYHLTLKEVLFLRLLNENKSNEILCAAVDGPTVIQGLKAYGEKKKADELQNTKDGKPD